MGIYIKGLSMPTEGNEAIIRIQPNGIVLDQYGHHLIQKAIPVLPHGRLGDLDELKAKIKKEDSGYEFSSFGDGMWTAFRSVYQCIDTAPTIIEAEKAE